jgi:hypothetical protein
MTEHQLQNEILRTFGTRSDMRIWRSNTGAASFGNSMVRFGIPGQADLTGLLPGGVRLEIEVKRVGNKQSNDQMNYQSMIERFGGIYILAYSVEDVWAKLKGYLEEKK